MDHLSKGDGVAYCHHRIGIEFDGEIHGIVGDINKANCPKCLATYKLLNMEIKPKVVERRIVGIVESVNFDSKPDIHTVTYNKDAQALAGKSHDFWKLNIGAIAGEWSYVHRSLKLGIIAYIKLAKLDPKDFDFRVKYADITEGGHFYPVFTGCGETVYLKNG